MLYNSALLSLHSPDVDNNRRSTHRRASTDVPILRRIKKRVSAEIYSPFIEIIALSCRSNVKWIGWAKKIINSLINFDKKRPVGKIKSRGKVFITFLCDDKRKFIEERAFYLEMKLFWTKKFQWNLWINENNFKIFRIWKLQTVKKKILREKFVLRWIFRTPRM